MKQVEQWADRTATLGWHAVRLYRLSRWLWVRGHRASALIVFGLNRVLTSVEIHPASQFGEGLVISHGAGIVVHHGTRAGRDCVLYQQVTLGAGGSPLRPVTLGDSVTIFAGAKVFGVNIADGATIGANAVVLTDVPAGSTAVGVPATVRRR